jgi:hypothetical protein
MTAFRNIRYRETTYKSGSLRNLFFDGLFRNTVYFGTPSPTVPVVLFLVHIKMRYPLLCLFGTSSSGHRVRRGIRMCEERGIQRSTGILGRNYVSYNVLVDAEIVNLMPVLVLDRNNTPRFAFAEKSTIPVQRSSTYKQELRCAH